MSPTSAARSSLEEMLESIRRRDDRPKDLPPALPVRPTSKARLPSSRRSLPINFKVGDSAPEYLPNDPRGRKGKKELKIFLPHKELGSKGGIFGSKKMRKEEPLAESPYVKAIGIEDLEERPRETTDSVNVLHPSASPSADEWRWSDNDAYLLRKKLRVWCRFPNSQWKMGRILSTSGAEAVILLSDGNEVTMSRENLLPSNPDILQGVDDLIQLSYLNEPSVLHNLQHRYSQEKIYVSSFLKFVHLLAPPAPFFDFMFVSLQTKAGPVLVAINPFKEVSLYGNDFVKAYKQKLTDSPHVYSIADNAFSEMMRGEPACIFGKEL
ncbi:hypothetical protein ACLOJK_015189 [Asimina triloba]